MVLAADCDDPEEEVVELAQKIEDAYMLPFVIVADSEGNYLGGASGMQTPEGLRATLEAGYTFVTYGPDFQLIKDAVQTGIRTFQEVCR